MTLRAACVFVAVAALTCACSRPSSQAAAQEGGTGSREPCSDATSQTELTQCWSAEAVQAGRRVADMQRQLTSAIGNEPEALARFERAQKQWEAYRDAHCQAVAGLSDGGSAAPLQQAHCEARLAASRETELKAILGDISR
jgi:uncharacterized protein YecT (DUF1311 family)